VLRVTCTCTSCCC